MKQYNKHLVTSNLNTKYPLPFDILWPWTSYILLLLVRPSWRRHKIDSNWLRFMESPTSISLLPLSLSKKSVALNLQLDWPKKILQMVSNAWKKNTVKQRRNITRQAKIIRKGTERTTYIYIYCVESQFLIPISDRVKVKQTRNSAQ